MSLGFFIFIFFLICCWMLCIQRFDTFEAKKWANVPLLSFFFIIIRWFYSFCLQRRNANCLIIEYILLHFFFGFPLPLSFHYFMLFKIHTEIAQESLKIRICSEYNGREKQKKQKKKRKTKTRVTYTAKQIAHVLGMWIISQTSWKRPSTFYTYIEY